MLKNGYILFEFIPLEFNRIEQRNVFKLQEKEIFTMNEKKVSELLYINPHLQSEFKVNFNYERDIKKMITIQNDSQRGVIIDYKSTVEGNTRNFQSVLSYPDLLLIQKLLDYSLPYITGWYGLDSSQIRDEDLVTNDFDY